MISLKPISKRLNINKEKNNHMTKEFRFCENEFITKQIKNMNVL